MIIFCNFEICFAKTLVRVSNYNVNESYREYNKVVNNVTKNYFIANKFLILGKEGGSYDNYLMKNIIIVLGFTEVTGGLMPADISKAAGLFNTNL